MIMRFIVGICMALVLASCAEVATKTIQTVNVDNVDQLYQIGPGDRLGISVWKEDNMALNVLVKPDGIITYPLIGDVSAEGLSTSELSDILVEKLKQFIPNPVVSVTVIESNSNKLYIVGKINKPGEYVVTRYLDVLQFISLAGGLSVFANSNRIKIIRREEGETKIFPFSYDDVVSGSSLEMNIVLKAGDTVVVP